MASADTVSWPRRVAVAVVVIAGVIVAGLAFGPVGAVVALLGAALLVQIGAITGRVPAAATRLGRGAASVTGALFLKVVPAAMGTVALLVVLDWGLGTGWNRLTNGPTEVPAGTDLVLATLPEAKDPRLDSPAMADAPWAERYFQELEAVPFTYVPFIGPREAPVRGRYINSADGIRRSYEPPGADGEDAVTVWFFGGSTLWGEGQRDLHTIPSSVARLAESDGVTLRAVNYGIRGYTAFQEFLVFEQELARRESPDVAVFYHGANEEAVLTEEPGNLGPQPEIFQHATVATSFERAPALPSAASPDEPSVALRYGETGAVNKLWRWLRDAVEDPAGADEPRFTPTPGQLERAADEAVQIYRRSIELIRHVADVHDVATLAFWQPAFQVRTNPDRYQYLGDQVADLTVDISDALVEASPDIYLDGLHTNEVGAQLSAEAIWRHLGPAIAEVER